MSLKFWADILALCTGMRPVVMIDYGGKMPELQDHLCALLKFIQQVWFFFSLYFIPRYYISWYIFHFVLTWNPFSLPNVIILTLALMQLSWIMCLLLYFSVYSTLLLTIKKRKTVAMFPLCNYRSLYMIKSLDDMQLHAIIFKTWETYIFPIQQPKISSKQWYLGILTLPK